ncbi:MAG: PmoA family protein, partial [Planctomycetia bacterium]|nr:PmoA family protein [Planctomycetia bacterium]
LCAGPSQADPYRVTVRGNGTELGETPVVTELKTMHSPSNYKLQPRAGGPAIPARVFQEGGKSYLAFVLKHVPAKGELTYSLESDGGSARPGTGVEFRPDGPNLGVFVGGKLLTVYRADEPTKPYYYPVIGPTGAEFSRAYPMKTDVAGETRDHPHQRSLWFTHGDVNGYDFWASDPVNKPNPKFGSIRETSRTILAAGPVVGVMRTTDDWLGPDGEAVCEDERVVRVFDTAVARIIDFDVTLKATRGSVTFGDTKEGMFGVRVASSMDVMKGKTRLEGKITNAEGVTDDAAWGKASPWVDYVGPVNGKTVGVAILNHPASFRYPTTWHVRTYGLFAANPFGWHDFGMKKSGAYTLPKGEQVRFRYRLILHEGDTAKARPADAFKAYSEPPAVELQRD